LVKRWYFGDPTGIFEHDFQDVSEISRSSVEGDARIYRSMPPLKHLSRRYGSLLIGSSGLGDFRQIVGALRALVV
jgi:hypothetical protein